jgi:hypothetical protein
MSKGEDLLPASPPAAALAEGADSALQIAIGADHLPAVGDRGETSPLDFDYAQMRLAVCYADTPHFWPGVPAIAPDAVILHGNAPWLEDKKLRSLAMSRGEWPRLKAAAGN